MLNGSAADNYEEGQGI